MTDQDFIDELNRHKNKLEEVVNDLNIKDYPMIATWFPEIEWELKNAINGLEVEISNTKKKMNIV